jgi:aryl-alcohol dehydrogenase-like predicted oxidoreductase
VNEKRIEAVKRLEGIARELGATTAQLALAWCASNPRVSTVITGASRPEQVAANLKAADLLPLMDEALRGRIEEATCEASDIGV